MLMPEKEELYLQMSRLWVVIRICDIASLVFQDIPGNLPSAKNRQVPTMVTAVLFLVQINDVGPESSEVQFAHK